MLTDKERMELLNLRKRCEAQREEIKQLKAELAKTKNLGGEKNRKKQKKMIDIVEAV